MKFKDWWNKYKTQYKGLADWKKTKFTMQCKEKIANTLRVGASVLIGLAAIYM